MEKPSIARHTGGGGNEPQGRQGKPPIESMLEPQPTLTVCLTEQLCHPELRILCRVRTESETRSIANKRECERSVMNDLFSCHTFSLAQRKSKPKESKIGWLSKILCHPELVSGSNPRDLETMTESQCLISKSDLLTENIKNIPSASRTAQRQVRGDFVPRKAAFTLAEVLITLGIIGVVAAMTLPTLIAKYQKQEVVTKLKRVYSVMNQAIQMSEAINGEAKYWDGLSVNPFVQQTTQYSELKAWYDKYLGPYLKTTKIMQANLAGDEETDPATEAYKTQGMLVYFADGTILHVGNNARDYSVYLNEKAIKNPMSGRNRFYFRFSTTESVAATGAQDKFQHGKKFEPYAWNWNGTREDLLRQGDDYGCTENGGAYCAKLIQFDGWQIKDDYPVRF